MVANQSSSLTLNIFARDRNAKKTLKDIGDQAEKTGNQVRGLNEMSSALRFGALLAAIPAMPSLAATVVGPLMALPALGAAGAAALGTVALAMKGTSQAARDLEYEVSQVGPAFGSLADDANAALAGPLRGALTELRDAYVPALRDDIVELAGAIGEAGANLADWATMPATVAKIERQFELATDVTREFGRMATAGADAVLDLADAGADFTRWFVTRLADGTESFRDFIAQAKRSGQLAQLFKNSQAALEGFGGLLADVGGLLFDIFSSPVVATGAELLFGTLRTGVAVVQTIVDLFGMLPGPLQAVVVAAGAVGSAVLLAFSAITKMRAAVLSATTSLQGMGAAGTAAATGLQRVTGAAGRVGGALAGTAILGQGVDAAFGKKGITTSATEASEALLEFARTGVWGGKQTKAFNGDLARLHDLIKSMDSDFGTGFSNWFAGSLESLTGTGHVFNDSFTMTTERIAALDAGLAELVRSGHAEEARQVLQRLADESAKGDFGTTFEDLTAGLTAYRGALSEVDRANREAAESATQHIGPAVELKEVIQESVGVFSDLREQIEALHGPERSLMELDEDFARLSRELTTTVAENTSARDKNSKSLSMNTETGQQNRDMLEALYDNALQTYLQMAKTHGIDKATTAYNNQKAEIERLATKVGFTKGEIAALYARMEKPPRPKPINWDVNIRVITSAPLFGPAGAIAGALGSYAFAHGEGGVNYAANGMITNSPTVVFGESARSRPEAYIPQHGIPRDRGRSLVDTTAGWFGGQVDWGGGGKGGGTTVVEIRSGGSEFDDALVGVLRRAIHVRGGNVQVALGRRA